MTRWGRTGLRTLLVTWATLGAAAASLKRFLILGLLGPDAVRFSSTALGFRNAPAKGSRESMHIAEIDLKLR
jgi:hypothetical protein